MKCFHAYTAPGASFPEFINVSRDDAGQIVVTVRSAPTFDVMQSDDPPLVACGPTAAIKLTRRQTDELITGLQKSLLSQAALDAVEGRVPTDNA